MITPAFNKQFPKRCRAQAANADMHVVEAKSIARWEMQPIDIDVHPALKCDYAFSPVDNEKFLVMHADIRHAGLEEVRKKTSFHDTVIVNGLPSRKLGHKIDGVGVVFTTNRILVIEHHTDIYLFCAGSGKESLNRG